MSRLGQRQTDWRRVNTHLRRPGQSNACFSPGTFAKNLEKDCFVRSRLIKALERFTGSLSKPDVVPPSPKASLRNIQQEFSTGVLEIHLNALFNIELVCAEPARNITEFLFV